MRSGLTQTFDVRSSAETVFDVIKYSALACALMATLIASPATAYADCGDPGQDPCTGPVPTVDQVVGIMQRLTDPNIPAANKSDIVTPGFAPDEAGTIDDHLHRMDGHSLPLNFVVTNIQPAPNGLAGATVATNGWNIHMYGPPGPIVLVEESGRWKLTHHAATSALDAYWYNATRFIVPFTK
jgi:hypothetical protein